MSEDKCTYCGSRGEEEEGRRERERIRKGRKKENGEEVKKLKRYEEGENGGIGNGLDKGKRRGGSLAERNRREMRRMRIGRWGGEEGKSAVEERRPLRETEKH